MVCKGGKVHQVSMQHKGGDGIADRFSGIRGDGANDCAQLLHDFLNLWRKAGDVFIDIRILSATGTHGYPRGKSWTYESWSSKAQESSLIEQDCNKSQAEMQIQAYLLSEKCLVSFELNMENLIEVEG
jgi:hypothetical protein